MHHARWIQNPTFGSGSDRRIFAPRLQLAKVQRGKRLPLFTPGLRLARHGASLGRHYDLREAER